MNNTTGTIKRTKKTVLNLVLNKGREKIMIINERKKDRFIMFVQYIYANKRQYRNYTVQENKLIQLSII